MKDRNPWCGRSSCLLRLWRTGRPRRMKAVPESMLDSVRKIVGNEAPGLSRYARDECNNSRGTRETPGIRPTILVLAVREDPVNILSREEERRFWEFGSQLKLKIEAFGFRCMFNSDYVVDYAFLR
ncbi:hypothetical protein L1987_83547 [Smallanthus sonchifolius]|uniref:Uncharacterized protein n=1 Tax=Smallanthus sonchifolius TaxID=185202 RepID=A0ACB8YDE6_9ASTR|nr:hypothetical protein L1987_83547 [Smallanthus sonchifolius]